MKDLGHNNTYLGLIVPESLTAFGVFNETIFYTLENYRSARIDSANEFQIFLMHLQLKLQYSH